MSKGKRHWWIVVVTAIVLGAVLIIPFIWHEVTSIAIGYFRGESFYQGLPSSYWREWLRERGQKRHSPAADFASFKACLASVPVLKECVNDSDKNVRWPAVMLLGQCGAGEAAVPLLRQALQDPDRQVQLQAIIGVGNFRRAARSATPELTKLAQSSDVDVSFQATRSLWRIDEDSALKAGHWKTLTSQDWYFSVSFPKRHKKLTKTLQTRIGPTKLHYFAAHLGPTIFSVRVFEFDWESLKSVPAKERWKWAQSAVQFDEQATLVHATDINQNNRPGKRYRYENYELYLDSCVFWLAGDCYHVSILGKPRFEISQAEEYFFGSFRINAIPPR